MLSKESKIRVLENFYGLDYVLFGKPVQKVEACCPELASEYVKVKGALLSVFIEMLKLVEHNPIDVLEEAIDSSHLRAMARESAVVARAVSEELIVTDKGRADIKSSLQEELNDDPSLDVDSLVKVKIREKAFSLAVDNLLVARTLEESDNVTALDEWEGRIVEEAYKVLRDSLVECAILILDDDDLS